jgi:hypothetical protein
MLTVVLAAAGSGDGGDDWKIIVPLIAATLALLGVLITLFVNGGRAERDRLRALYADGWAAVQAYKEMAFAIRHGRGGPAPRRRPHRSPGCSRLRGRPSRT